MDDLDRIYHRLVHGIRLHNPEYLTVPFTVQELYEDLIPYRHHRRELGIETNQDYEVAIARLLSGERGYLRGDPKMAERLTAEVASATGDFSAFREFASTRVTLAPEPLKATAPAPAPESVRTEPAPPRPAAAEMTEIVPTSLDAGTTEQPAVRSPSHTDTEPRGSGCRFCGGTLPGGGRGVTYCPHCGQNLSVKNCPACSTELETGWKFCVTCGRNTG